MTVTEDSVDTAITDARALLDTMLAGEWKDLHVTSGDTEIFIARGNGRANPMRVAPAVAAAPAAAAPAAAQGAELALKAPHVATLAWAAAAGTLVAAGDRVAELSVLDEAVAVTAPVAGQVLRVEAAVGELIEFDQPYLTLREVA